MHEPDDNCVLLGYYAASSGNFLLMFQDDLSVPSLMMGPTGSPKTLVSNYHYLLRNNPQECSS